MPSHRIFLSLVRKRQPQKIMGIAIILTFFICAPFLFSSVASFVFLPDPFLLFPNILFRYAIVVSAVTSFICYQDLIRDPIRRILDPHPIDGGADFFSAYVLHTISKTISTLISVLALFWPVLLYKSQYSHLWFGMSFFLSLVWISSIFVGYTVCLGAIKITRDEQFGPFLDVIRGSNPREQAAFLYVPGVSLLLMGVTISFACNALGYALQQKGGPVMWLWIFLPTLLGGVAFVLSRKWMKDSYAYGSIVRNDIDAQWNIIDEYGQEAEEHTVYLESLASHNRPEFRRNLRQGWREFRIWIIGSWVFGAIAGFYVLQNDIGFALQMTLFGSLVVAGLPTQLQKGDPIWLENQLPLPLKRIRIYRSLVSVLYAQGILLPVFISLLFIETAHMTSWLVIEMTLLLAAVIASYLPRSNRSFMIYIPVMAVFLICVLPFLSDVV